MVTINMSTDIIDIKTLTQQLTAEYGERLCAIISAGSLTTPHFEDTWSDIDLLLVFDEIPLKIKLALAITKASLEKRYGRKFGINVVTRQEATRPNLPEISLDGKTLQALLELSTHPERLLYRKDASTHFYTPDIECVRRYSLSNISMFLLRNRKLLTSELSDDISRLKKTAEREMRACFIITKLAIQYAEGYTCSVHKEVASRSLISFPDFDTSFLEESISHISQWKEITSQITLNRALEGADAYIESFARYVFSNIADRSK